MPVYCQATNPYILERTYPIGTFHDDPNSEPTILIGVDAHQGSWTIQDSLEELARLVETTGAHVVGSVTQRLSRPVTGTYMGKGKIAEVRDLIDSLEAEMVVCNDELSPAQLRNLEKAFDVKVIDRTALILDVFARRAQTHEGRLQVELAQLEYRLPRLTRMWTHLSRQAGGGGGGGGGVGLRGPGETQLEADRREAGKRVAYLKTQLQEVHRHRQLYRDRRHEQQAPVIALVGYTNAGKSTLLNTITGADVFAEDQLFATLDPTTRRIELPSHQTALLTDTVGFINKLPTMLVAAFRATLEEINEATVIVHVVDVTHPNAPEHMATVDEVLADLAVDDKPTILALNKVDRCGAAGVPSIDELRLDLNLPDDAIAISGHTGQGLDDLIAAVEAALDEEKHPVRLTVVIPYSRGDLVEQFHRLGKVTASEYQEDGTRLTGRIPAAMVERFEEFRVAPPETPPIPLPQPVAAAQSA